MSKWNPDQALDCLGESSSIVNGDRRIEYGTPLDNHERTAKMWTAYLGARISAEDVCMMNILQKISRNAFKEKRDNIVDIIGYAANYDLVKREREYRGE